MHLTETVDDLVDPLLGVFVLLSTGRILPCWMEIAPELEPQCLPTVVVLLQVDVLIDSLDKTLRITSG